MDHDICSVNNLSAVDPGGPADHGLTDAAREFFELSFRYFRLHREHVEGLLADLRLTPVDMHALRALAPTEPLATSLLSQRIHVEPSNVTAVVDRLLRRGLVERRPHPTDRRIRFVALTDEGRRVRAELLRRLRPPAVLGRLTPAQQEQLRDLFATMLRP